MEGAAMITTAFIYVHDPKQKLFRAMESALMLFLLSPFSARTMIDDHFTQPTSQQSPRYGSLSAHYTKNRPYLLLDFKEKNPHI
jgi:hypothetical protein